jgi:hypothetical protein
MRFPYQGTESGDNVISPASRQQAVDLVRLRGAPTPPASPRDVVAQSSARGVFVTWGLPGGDSTGITGWKVYVGDESTLYQVMPSRASRSVSVESTAGTTPTTVNIFVSSINALGLESPKIQVQSKATVEAAAPAAASFPPGYGNTGGSDTSTAQGTGGRTSFSTAAKSLLNQL